jgi:hypothetical protein
VHITGFRRHQIRGALGRQQPHIDATRVALGVQARHERRSRPRRGDRLLDDHHFRVPRADRFERQGHVGVNHRNHLCALAGASVPRREQRLGSDEKRTRVRALTQGAHICLFGRVKSKKAATSGSR